MLTLLLTLKDRYEFTEHILTYFNEINFKYHILIADGSTLENQEKLKNRIAEFKNLQVTLDNYKPDQSLADYYAKLNVATEKISTPYTLLIDNDDYFSEEGCTKAIEFLESHPDYIAAGQLAHFINYNHKVYFSNAVYGDYDQDDLSERAKAYLSGPLSIWGLVTRTAGIKAIFKEVRECNFTYLHLIEFLFNLKIISLGKVKFIHDSPCTLRRLVTQNSSSMDFIEGNLHYNFYYKSFFFNDWRKLVDRAKIALPVNEAALEYYWFRGCINGYKSSQNKSRNKKMPTFIKKIYYEFKYRKNWSPVVKIFEKRLEKL